MSKFHGIWGILMTSNAFYLSQIVSFEVLFNMCLTKMNGKIDVLYSQRIDTTKQSGQAMLGNFFVAAKSQCTF